MTDVSEVGSAEIWAALRFGAGPAAFAVLWGLFAKLEDIMSPQAKQDIAAWLRRTEIPGTLTSWPRQFAALFDRVFGENHLSWRCFFRSCLASLVAVAVFTVIGAVLWPDEAERVLQGLNNPFIPPIYIGVVLFLNLLPDYISLLESRFVLKIICIKDSLISALALTVLDAAASVIIFLSSVYVILLIVVPDDVVPDDIIYGFIQDLMNHGLFLKTNNDAPSIGIFFYSSLFTSIWAWLYVLSAGTIRLVLRLQPLFGWLKYFLDIDKKPIRSIGFVVGLIGAVFWWGLVLIVGLEV